MAKKAVKKVNKKTTAIAKRGTSEVSTDVKFDSALAGAEANVDNQDILIPKARLMQDVSQLVKDDVAKAGEFRNSLDGELIAAKGGNFDCIIFDSYKVWHEYTVDEKGKKKFSEVRSFNENPDLAYNEPGVHRDKVQAFYVLMLDEITAGLAFPYVVDFKSTDFKTGQKLSTAFAKLRTIGKPSYAKIFNVSTVTKSNDEGSWFGKEVSIGRDITGEEKDQVETWIKTMMQKKQAGAVKTDDSDLKEVKEADAGPVSSREF
jgi:hypothetical protein